jgi:serine protease Do
MGSDDPRGMRISGVSVGSPAEAAGVKAGDILVSFDGKAVPNIEALQEVLTAAKAGVTVKIVVLRGDQRLELSLTPAAPQS